MKISRIFLVLVLITLCGCITYEEDLKINSDGSGRIKQHISFPKEGSRTFMETNIPETREELEEKLGVGLKLISFDKAEEANFTHLYVTIDFDDYKALSSLQKSSGSKGSGIFGDQEVRLKRSGLNFVFERILKKRGKDMFDTSEDEEDNKDAVKKKLMEKLMEKMFERFIWKFSLTTPSRIISTNGKKIGPNTVKWEVPLVDLVKEDFKMTAKIEGPNYYKFLVIAVPGVILILLIIVGIVIGKRVVARRKARAGD